MDPLRVKSLAIGHAKKGSNYVAPNPGSTGISGYAKKVSAAGDFYLQAAFDLSQMLIKLPAEIGETVVVGGLQDDVPGYLYGVQCGLSKPL